MSSSPCYRRPLVAIMGLMALAALGGCRRHTMVELTGPPDLAKAGQTDPHSLALRMRVFHVNHIWSGAGFEADGADYRAKVTIWSYSQGEPALAELYFHDADRFDPAGRHKNSAPGVEPYQVHFPMSTLGPILSLLRSANEPVYLFYFRGKWAIGTSLAEAIGSE